MPSISGCAKGRGDAGGGGQQRKPTHSYAKHAQPARPLPSCLQRTNGHSRCANLCNTLRLHSNHDVQQALCELVRCSGPGGAQRYPHEHSSVWREGEARLQKPSRIAHAHTLREHPSDGVQRVRSHRMCWVAKHLQQSPIQHLASDTNGEAHSGRPYFASVSDSHAGSRPTRSYSTLKGLASLTARSNNRRGTWRANAMGTRVRKIVHHRAGARRGACGSTQREQAAGPPGTLPAVCKNGHCTALSHKGTAEVHGRYLGIELAQATRARPHTRACAKTRTHAHAHTHTYAHTYTRCAAH
jgi:hypothetical protein